MTGRHFSRYRFPVDQGMRLVVILAAVLGALACIAIVAAGVAISLVVGQYDDIRQTQQGTFVSRREASYQSCRRDEKLKADLRAVIALRRRDGDPSALPRDSHGRPVFSPLRAKVRGNNPCEEYARKAVPEPKR